MTVPDDTRESDHRDPTPQAWGSRYRGPDRHEPDSGASIGKAIGWGVLILWLLIFAVQIPESLKRRDERRRFMDSFLKQNRERLSSGTYPFHGAVPAELRPTGELIEAPDPSQDSAYSYTQIAGNEGTPLVMTVARNDLDAPIIEQEANALLDAFLADFEYAWSHFIHVPNPKLLEGEWLAVDADGRLRAAPAQNELGTDRLPPPVLSADTLAKLRADWIDAYKKCLRWKSMSVRFQRSDGVQVEQFALVLDPRECYLKLPPAPTCFTLEEIDPLRSPANQGIGRDDAASPQQWANPESRDERILQRPFDNLRLLLARCTSDAQRRELIETKFHLAVIQESRDAWLAGGRWGVSHPPKWGIVPSR